MANTTNPLHLPDLTITGFRGIDALSMARLGRVTLLVGKNGIGKTTVLEAVKLYAARGSFQVLTGSLLDREEANPAPDDGEMRMVPDWQALFFGRVFTEDATIWIGPENEGERLSIRLTKLSDAQVERLAPSLKGSLVQALETSFMDTRQLNPFSVIVRDPLAQIVPRVAWLRASGADVRSIMSHEDPPSAIGCATLGPGLPDKGMLMRLWDTVALTDDEELAVSALTMMCGSEVERVAVVGDNNARNDAGQSGRRVVVKLKGHPRPVPLASLGDGAMRLFSVAVALANCRNGFLLIDEAENGIHYGLQRDFWNMVLQTAQAGNVQVIATTHSWDCVTGFAQAASEYNEAEGVLVRLSRQYGSLRAVEYSEKNLKVAAEQRIEVR